MFKKHIITRWEVIIYDVWGNAKDGYEVNDATHHGTVKIYAPLNVNNPGTKHEFISAYPTESQIRKAFGIKRYKLDLDGDDMIIYVNVQGKPFGELRCVSHKSLSPVKV